MIKKTSKKYLRYNISGIYLRVKIEAQKRDTKMFQLWSITVGILSYIYRSKRVTVENKQCNQIYRSIKYTIVKTNYIEIKKNDMSYAQIAQTSKKQRKQQNSTAEQSTMQML